MIADCTASSFRLTISNQHTLSNTLLLVLETVSAYALSFFAAMVNPALYYPFSMMGVAMGLHQHFYPQLDRMVPNNPQSYSFLEQLTKIRFSPFLTLGINTAVTWTLIESHSAVLVPVVALYMGAWTGRTVGRVITYLKNNSL